MGGVCGVFAHTADGKVESLKSSPFRGTFTDPSMDTYTITWDFGDDSKPVSITQGVPSAYSQDAPRVVEANHEYSSSGIYTVKLTVKDDDEESRDTLTVKIETPANLTAEIHFENTDIDEGENIIYVSQKPLFDLK